MTQKIKPKKIKLSDKNVRDLALPEGKDDHTWWDSEEAGFGYRIQRKRDGSLNKNWVVFYRFGGKQHKPHFKVSQFKAEAARKIAENYLAQVRLNINPAAERDKAREAASAITLTLGDTVQRYLDAKRAKLRPSTFKSNERHLNVHFAPLAARPFADVKRAEIAAQLQTIIKEHGTTAAARARGALSSLYTWAMGEGLCEANPVVGTNDPLSGVDNSRDRVLSNSELASVWNACLDDDFGKIVKLLILTGCRRDEIGSLRWSEINLDAGTLTVPAERSKNRRSHSLTLPPMALDILRSIPRRDGRDYVFGQRGGGYARWGWYHTALRERLGEMRAWTLHDLRRTAATQMAEIGIQPHIIEAVLNHVSGHKAGVAGVYNRASYTEPMRLALQRWADHIRVILDGRSASNVVNLARIPS
jgi:integrase